MRHIIFHYFPHMFMFKHPMFDRWCQLSARYVGVSAGAILAGRTCDTAYWKGWDDPTVVPEEERQDSLATWLCCSRVIHWSSNGWQKPRMAWA